MLSWFGVCVGEGEGVWEWLCARFVFHLFFFVLFCFRVFGFLGGKPLTLNLKP